MSMDWDEYIEFVDDAEDLGFGYEMDSAAVQAGIQATIIRAVSEFPESVKSSVRSSVEKAKVTTGIATTQKRTLDEYAFVLGVMNMGLTAYIIGKAPSHYYYFYTIKFIAFLGYRLYEYYNRGWHYFLFDYCYYVNILIMCYVWLFPHNALLFQVIFVSSFGPLALAIVAWRNALVFHSLGKITSLFIHISPVLLVWGVRFHSDPAEFTVCLDEACSLPLSSWLGYPMEMFAIWQVLYYLKVYYHSWEKVESNARQTSYGYLMSDKGGLAKWANKLGFARHKVAFFILVQASYTFVFMLPAWVWYHYEHLAFAFVLAITGVSANNGAKYYFEVFAKRYEQAIEKNNSKWESAVKQIIQAQQQTG